MVREKYNRASAHKHISTIDNLQAAILASGVTKVVVAELVGIEYVTLDKYLRKERNVRDEEVVKRMVVATNLLNDMVAAGLLPIAVEINARLRTSVALEEIDKFVGGQHDKRV